MAGKPGFSVISPLLCVTSQQEGRRSPVAGILRAISTQKGKRTQSECFPFAFQPKEFEFRAPTRSTSVNVKDNLAQPLHRTALLSTHGTFGSSGSNMVPDLFKMSDIFRNDFSQFKTKHENHGYATIVLLNKRNLTLETKCGSCCIEFVKDHCGSTQHQQRAAWTSKALIPSPVIQMKSCNSAQSQGPEPWVGRVVNSFDTFRHTPRPIERPHL